jgi:hypothetical protein
VLMTIPQLPAGDPDAQLFVSKPGVARWRKWFGAWTNLQTFAFICEDFWWWRLSDVTLAQASEVAENIVQDWLTNSSLERFEIWSSATDVQLSNQFKVAYARFHNIHKTEPTRHRYSFQCDELTRTWVLSSPMASMCSAISQFSEHICGDGCWICIAIDEEEDLESLISYLDDVREEDWHDRMMELTLWSKLSCDHSYKLSV